MPRSLLLVLLLAATLVGCDSSGDDEVVGGAFALLDGQATAIVRADASALDSDALDGSGFDLDSLGVLLPFDLPANASLYGAAQVDGATDLGGAIAGIAGGELVIVFPGGTSDVRQALAATLTQTTGEGDFDLFVDDQLEAVIAVDDSRVVVASRESIVRAMLRRGDSDRLGDDAQALLSKTDALPVGLLIQDSGVLIDALLGDDSPIPASALPFRRAAVGSTFDAGADATIDATIWLEPLEDSNAAALAGAVTTIATLASQSSDLDEQTRALLNGLSPIVDGRFVRIAVSLPLATLLPDSE